MSTRGPSQVSSNGLVFYYDTFNNKSYLGEPTVNYSYDHNPRIDQSYSLWSPGYGGTFATKHPDAIRVYNDAGSEITSYVNTGVTDWTNTYHAIWTYDPVLQRPVVTMRDIDGQWKAKYIYTGINFNSLGMTVGSKYTISWLQWTDNLTKRANVGLYTRNNSVVYNFWDGLSGGSSTSTNTLTNTWQRVYHTFTVTSNWNLSDSWNQIYMYGMDYVRGTVKIADVQFELKDHPTQFSKAQTRSVTTGLVDLTGNCTVNLNSSSFDTAANITFGGSNCITVDDTSAIALSGDKSFCMWIYFDQDASCGFGGKSNGTVSGMSLGYGWSGGGFMALAWNTANSPALAKDSRDYKKWVYLAAVQGGSTRYIYAVDAIGIRSTSSSGGTHSWSNSLPLKIGRINDHAQVPSGTKIGEVSVYNRALTQSEVLQNFNRSKSRYGL